MRPNQALGIAVSDAESATSGCRGSFTNSPNIYVHERKALAS